MKFSEIKKTLTVVIISHKSGSKVNKFLKKISNLINIIIVDNSGDLNLRKSLKKRKNTKILFMKNRGYGSAINYARNHINTKYFFVFSPDLEGINNALIYEFYKKTNSKLNFGALGPRFLNVTQKSHRQSNIENKIGKINAISGSAIFINVKAFDKINGFDSKIFLFFEENDFCRRLNKAGYNIYQLNNTFVKHSVGINSGVVELSNNSLKNKLINLYNWHFLWSKFYYFKKHYGIFLTLIYFIPIIARTLFRVLLYKTLKEKDKELKYKSRFVGLYNSILGKASYKRL